MNSLMSWENLHLSPKLHSLSWKMVGHSLSLDLIWVTGRCLFRPLTFIFFLPFLSSEPSDLPEIRNQWRTDRVINISELLFKIDKSFHAWAVLLSLQKKITSRFWPCSNCSLVSLDRYSVSSSGLWFTRTNLECQRKFHHLPYVLQFIYVHIPVYV